MSVGTGTRIGEHCGNAFSFDCQSKGGLRSCLMSVRRCFAFRRRSFAPRLGFVGLRAGEGGRRAAATTVASRARAASLLRSWVRYSDAVIVSTPPTRRPLSRSRSRSRWSGERTAEPAASQTISARESAVFTPCPPGPDDRENRHDSSDSGIVTPESIRSPGRWAAGMNPSSSCLRRVVPMSRTPRCLDMRNTAEVPVFNHRAVTPSREQGGQGRAPASRGRTFSS